MKREQTGALTIILGIILFVTSFFLLLPILELYLVSLFLLFIASIMIAVGGALIKGIDKTLDASPDDCYYCKGTGSITGSEETGSEVCPRCGGTGLARPDDYE